MRRRWHSVAYALGATTATCACVFGCSLITSFDGYGGVDAGTIDPSCSARKSIPLPPDKVTSRSPRTLTGMMQSAKFIDITPTGPVPLPGYDIDEVCSSPTNKKGSCSNPAGIQADQEGTGADNAIAQNVASLGDARDFQVLITTPRDVIQENIENGKHGLAIRIDGYDGPNDDKVTVDVINVVGIVGSGDGGAKANFDGNDRLVLDVADLTSTTLQSKANDPNAFVRDGMLYALFREEFRIRLVAPSVDNKTRELIELPTFIPLMHMRLIGKVEPQAGGGLKMTTATITGRLPIASLFEAVFAYGVCPERGNFNNVDNKICSIADVLASGATRAATPCDAVSFAFQLNVVPVAPLDERTSRAAPPVTPVCTSKRPTTCPHIP